MGFRGASDNNGDRAQRFDHRGSARRRSPASGQIDRQQKEGGSVSEGRTQGGRSKRSMAVVGALAGVAIVVAGYAIVRVSPSEPACEVVSTHPGWSVARRWDEAHLDAIRRALPAPTVHARNLFHISVAMWDAWAAYDPDAAGYFVDEKHAATDVAAARNEAISYAAYRVLEHRYHERGRRDGLDPRVRPAHGGPVLPDRRHEHRGRQPGGAREPDRSGGDRLRARRRIERGRWLQRATTSRSTRRSWWRGRGRSR